jgi:hypothetical protein
MQKPRKFRRFGWIFFPVWIAGVSIFICMATADSLWGFELGYRPQDIVLCFGMLGFGLLFWLVWDWFFKLAERYGPPE